MPDIFCAILVSLAGHSQCSTSLYKGANARTKEQAQLSNKLITEYLTNLPVNLVVGFTDGSALGKDVVQGCHLHQWPLCPSNPLPYPSFTQIHQLLWRTAGCLASVLHAFLTQILYHCTTL